jgi:nitric oxide reductase large subunit
MDITFIAHSRLSARDANAWLFEKMADKKIWMRVNRILAWALVVSPVLQIVLRTNLVNGLWLDLAILIAHAVLSVALFGLPKNKNPRQIFWTRWACLPELGMSPRHQFLLSGWRVAVSSLWLVGLFGGVALCQWMAPSAPDSIKTISNIFFLSAIYLGGFFGLLLPYGVVTHLGKATMYALRRWGNARDDTTDLASLVVLLFLAASVVNLFRPLWR